MKITDIRERENGYAPVLIELKYTRARKRLIEQIDNYAPVIDANQRNYSKLFSALLGKKIELVAPCEKWIVWPAAWDTGDPKWNAKDPRTDEFREIGIGTIAYTKDKNSYSFWFSG